MKNKMSYADQQRLKRNIAGRLKAAVQSVERVAGQPENNMTAMPGNQPPVHIMPDGMECTALAKKADSRHTGSERVSKNQVLKAAVVLSEVISEPMCKKRHRKRRL